MAIPTPLRRLFFTVSAAVLGPTIIYFVLISHTAWGDDRYVMKPESVREQIARIDTELGVVDTEILFAETPNKKAKFEAIKAIYERQKETLRERLKKLE